MEAGVDPKKTAIRGYGRDVIFDIFDSCEAGDLLVMVMGHVEKHLLPTWIVEYPNKIVADK